MASMTDQVGAIRRDGRRLRAVVGAGARAECGRLLDQLAPVVDAGAVELLDVGVGTGNLPARRWRVGRASG